MYRPLEKWISDLLNTSLCIASTSGSRSARPCHTPTSILSFEKLKLFLAEINSKGKPLGQILSFEYNEYDVIKQNNFRYYKIKEKLVPSVTSIIRLSRLNQNDVFSNSQADSFEIGNLLKQLYIDSALRKDKDPNKDKVKKYKKPKNKMSWKQFKESQLNENE